MAGEFSAGVLRLEPRSIPAVRAAIEESLDELRPALLRLGFSGYILEPWLGDPMSRNVADYYNRQVMDSPEGPYAALVAYEARLDEIRLTLVEMEAAYRRTEGDEVARWGQGQA